jgi:hypothetical protein
LNKPVSITRHGELKIGDVALVDDIHAKFREVNLPSPNLNMELVNACLVKSTSLS